MKLLKILWQEDLLRVEYYVYALPCMVKLKGKVIAKWCGLHAQNVSSFHPQLWSSNLVSLSTLTFHHNVTNEKVKFWQPFLGFMEDEADTYKWIQTYILMNPGKCWFHLYTQCVITYRGGAENVVDSYIYMHKIHTYSVMAIDVCICWCIS